MSRYSRLRLDIRTAYPGILGLPPEDQYPLREEVQIEDGIFVEPDEDEPEDEDEP